LGLTGVLPSCMCCGRQHLFPSFDGCVVVSPPVPDVTDRSTFTGIKKWIDKVKHEADPNCAMLIVGNKADICDGNSERRQVELAEVKKYAEPFGARVIEVSAKTGHNIPKVFTQVRCFQWCQYSMENVEFQFIYPSPLF
jgi:hypothetical protein